MHTTPTTNFQLAANVTRMTMPTTIHIVPTSSGIVAGPERRPTRPISSVFNRVSNGSFFESRAGRTPTTWGTGRLDGGFLRVDMLDIVVPLHGR